MNVPASDLWDLDWVHAAEEVPSWSDLTRSTWPLTPGTLNSDLQGTSTFVRGTLDGTYQEAKKKRKADALCSEGAQPKKAKKVKKEPAKFYCAQCQKYQSRARSFKGHGGMASTYRRLRTQTCSAWVLDKTSAKLPSYILVLARAKFYSATNSNYQ